MPAKESRYSGTPSPAPLTLRQREVLALIDGYLAAHSCGPTLDEIAASAGVGAASGVLYHILALERKGYLYREPSFSNFRASSKAMKILCRRSGRHCLIAGQWFLWTPVEELP